MAGEIEGQEQRAAPATAVEMAAAALALGGGNQPLTCEGNCESPSCESEAYQGASYMRLHSIAICVGLLVTCTVSAEARGAPAVSVSVKPRIPIIERHGAERLLNFDMVVSNSGKETYRIAKIELSVYDRLNELAMRKALNTDAFAPSISVIGDATLSPSGELDVFNPFSQFEAEMPLNRLRYDFCLQKAGTQAERDANRHRLPDDCDFTTSVSIQPREYFDRTALVLPVKNKVFIWEGHDFYAHHFRVPLGNPRMKSMGLLANSNEFASDFVYTDANGSMYRGDPRTLTNWFSYGKPIYAPGAGTVIDAANDIPDNRFKDARAASIGYPELPPGKDPHDLGNHVLIDHGNGEFSLLLHMKPGSVRVKVGEHVSAGEEIGAIGFSGDAIFPHLHYTLMDGPQSGTSWGLPAYFKSFRRYFGSSSREVRNETVNSGDFVEAQ